MFIWLRNLFVRHYLEKNNYIRYVYDLANTDTNKIWTELKSIKNQIVKSEQISNEQRHP